MQFNMCIFGYVLEKHNDQIFRINFNDKCTDIFVGWKRLNAPKIMMKLYVGSNIIDLNYKL